MNDHNDPIRTVGLVIVGLAVAFLGVLVAIQFGGGSPEAVLTLPLVVAVPVVLAALYWYLRDV